YSSRKWFASARAKKRSATDSYPPSARWRLPEVAAAHMDADDDIVRTGRDRVIDGIDIALDQRIGIATGARNLVADRAIAQQRNGDLVDLQVATARLRQVRDLLLKHADEIGEKAINVGIGRAIGEVGKAQEVHGRWRRQRDLRGDARGSAQKSE